MLNPKSPTDQQVPPAPRSIPNPHLAERREQTKQLRRIADALETLAALKVEEREEFDTGDTPPSVDLAGRPIGAGRG